MVEVKEGYCPLCDMTFEFYTEGFIEYCPLCNHHLCLHRIAGKGCIPQALLTAHKLADMILFHKRVRENGTKMMQPWED